MKGVILVPSVDGTTIEIQLTHEADLVSDGYHTFDELYAHRCMLFCMIAKMLSKAQIDGFRTWKSWAHHDGSTWSGWFIAGLELGPETITYHLPASAWDLYAGETLANAPEWDGHTSQDVINRLQKWLESAI